MAAAVEGNMETRDCVEKAAHTEAKDGYWGYLLSFPDFEGMDMMKAKSHNPSRANRQAGRRSSIQHLSGTKPAADPSPSSSLSGRRSSLSVSNKKRATVIDKSKSPRLASPTPSNSPSTSSSPVSAVSLKRRGSVQANFGATSQERSGLMLPWEVIAIRLREGAKTEPCSGFLRVPALMELLCKVAFSYLGCYGNMQQRSMSTLMQSVWLLVYIRFSVESLRSSFHRRRLSDEEDRYGPLGRAVRSLGAEAWKLRKVEEPQAVSKVKPIPREVLRQTTKQAAEGPQEGTPYVLDQRCQLCKSTVEAGSWGNLRCFGCSKIDSLPFRRHPLISLLRKSGDKPVALAGKVPRVRSTSLSPVRFQANDTLRPGDEDEAEGSCNSTGREGSFAPSSGS